VSAPAIAQTVPAPLVRRPEKSLWRYSWDRFRRNRLAVLGLLFLAIMMGSALLAPWIAPYNPNAVSLAPEDLLQPPSREHLFGTDELGRDVFSRALYGARISLLVGFVATGVFDPARRMGEISILAVDPKHQTSGIGTALTEFALDRLAEDRMKIAMVETSGDPGHAPARRTYEGAGFTLLPIAGYFKNL